MWISEQARERAQELSRELANVLSQLDAAKANFAGSGIEKRAIENLELEMMRVFREQGKHLRSHYVAESGALDSDFGKYVVPESEYCTQCGTLLTGGDHDCKMELAKTFYRVVYSNPAHRFTASLTPDDIDWLRRLRIGLGVEKDSR